MINQSELMIIKNRNTKRIPAHPLICWLSKLFRPLDPWVEIQVPKDNKYVYNFDYSRFIVTPEQYRIIKDNYIS